MINVNKVTETNNINKLDQEINRIDKLTNYGVNKRLMDELTTTFVNKNVKAITKLHNELYEEAKPILMMYDKRMDQANCLHKFNKLNNLIIMEFITWSKRLISEGKPFSAEIIEQLLKNYIESHNY